MLSSDTILESPLNSVDLNNRDWLAGALAGLSVSTQDDDDWRWESFERWVLEKVAELNIPSPLFPSPVTRDESMLDVLGGYLSTASRNTAGGLLVKMPSRGDLLGVMRLLRISLVILDNEVLVPHTHFVRLLRYVSVRGPLEEDLFDSGVISDA